MEDINKQSKLLKPWQKLRDILFSNEKLQFLSEFSTTDLNLFIKSIDKSGKVKLIYKNINELFSKEILQFQEIQIIKPINSSSKSELIQYDKEKIDNTGNVALWPCEEILAVYTLLNKPKFENKRIIELGSGFSGLCSLIMKKHLELKDIVITDGNSHCVSSLRENYSLNFSDLKEESCRILLWDEKFTKENDFGEFDFVIISDCLFFKNYHDALVNTIRVLLHEKGECIIVSPPRGKTMDNFIEKAKKLFHVYVSKEEISFINLTKNKKDLYDPFFIRLTPIII